MLPNIKGKHVHFNLIPNIIYENEDIAEDLRKSRQSDFFLPFCLYNIALKYGIDYIIHEISEKNDKMLSFFENFRYEKEK